MDKIDNHSFYYKAYKNHGVSAKGLKWSSKERQYLRFEVLIDFLKKDLKDSSLLDIGSGYGDLINYLQENSIYPNKYLGIDCEDFILDIAKKRFPNSNFLKLNFLEDELPKFDYVVLSGALNILPKEEFLLGIEKCFEASKKGFVFNFLTKSFVHGLSSFDIYMYCQTLSGDLEIKNDYLDNDFTIYMKK